MIWLKETISEAIKKASLSRSFDQGRALICKQTRQTIWSSMANNDNLSRVFMGWSFWFPEKNWNGVSIGDALMDEALIQVWWKDRQGSFLCIGFYVSQNWNRQLPNQSSPLLVFFEHTPKLQYNYDMMIIKFVHNMRSERIQRTNI